VLRLDEMADRWLSARQLPKRTARAFNAGENTAREGECGLMRWDE
jgi:hypothetical protein